MLKIIIESEKTRNCLSKPVAMVASIGFSMLAARLVFLLPMDAQVFQSLEDTILKFLEPNFPDSIRT